MGGARRPTPLRAIKAKCLECSNSDKNEVANCPVKSCPLYIYRFGMDPEYVEKRRKELGGGKKKEGK